MITKNWLVGVFSGVFALAFLAGCSKDEGDKRSPKLDGVGAFDVVDVRARILRITDLNGKPVSKAQILIGEAVNSPFVSNFLTTDAQGTFKAPDAWTSEQTLTISAAGFVRASYFGQVPQGQTFQLRPAQTSGNYELKGQGSGFQPVDKDNVVDFALAIPTITRGALLNFDMGLFISPLTDEVAVYNQKMQIPSNVMLPKQKEKYGIFPVTLEKPVYRTYFPTPGPQQIMAARGQFPFKEVVKELQANTPFVQLVNYFTLLGGSVRMVNISAPTQNLDLPVTELVFNQSRNFKSAVFADDEFLLAVPLSPYKDQWLPTDIKNVASNVSLKLTTAAGSQPEILVVMKKKADANELAAGRLTAAMVPFEENVAPVLIPLIENPTVLDRSHVKVRLPALPSSIREAAMYSLLSTVDSRIEGGVQYESVSKLWEVYSNQWQAEIQLPVWPNDTVVAGKKRWEVTVTGVAVKGAQNKVIALSPRILENVTHATHGSSDF